MNIERLFSAAAISYNIFCAANAQEFPVCELTDRNILWFEAEAGAVVFETHLIGDGLTYPRAERRIIFEDGRVIAMAEGAKFFADPPWPSCQAHIAFSKRATVRSIASPVYTFEPEFRPVLDVLLGNAACAGAPGAEHCMAGDRLIFPAMLSPEDADRLRTHNALVFEATISTFVTRAYAYDREHNALIELLSEGD